MVNGSANLDNSLAKQPKLWKFYHHRNNEIQTHFIDNNDKQTFKNMCNIF